MKKIFAGIALVALVWACQKEIPLKQEEIDPRIVINSIFAEEDTVWVHVSESRTVLHQGELPNITNATVRVLDANDAVLGTLTHQSNGNYYMATPTPVAGNTYKLEVEASGFNSVSASSETPSIISITDVDTTTAVANDQIEFTLHFNDDGTQTNYYAVSIVFYASFTDPETGEEAFYEAPYFTTKEIVTVNGEQDVDGQKWGMEFFFSDETFNGQSFEFTGRHYLDEWAEPGSFYVVSLKSLSEDLYKYKLSYSNYLSVDGSPFAEPVQVYSNIQDGFGIFGGYSTYRDTVYAP